MLTDHASVLRKVMDIRNLLDILHKKGFRLKSRMEGLALSRVIHVLRESEAFRGECIQPRAIVNGWDPNTNQATLLCENGQIIQYLRDFENLNKEVMSKNDRFAFYEVRWLVNEMEGFETADQYYLEVICW